MDHQSKTKTIRFNEITDKDYISELPDCLLVDFISRLPLTQQAIQTGTLSKRWQHLWRSVSNLIFDFYMSSPKKWNLQRLSDFVSFVDETLTQRPESYLTKFQLLISYDTQFQSKVNDWIRYAFRCNVQDLDLFIVGYDDEFEFVLDGFFFVNTTFTRLKLEGCLFNHPGAISWTNLQTLHITQGYLDEDLIRNILSGCPLLELLYLQRCHGFGWIDITSKSVKKLVLDGYFDSVDPLWYEDVSDSVVINAPHLLSLSIKERLLLWKVELLDVSSLVEAELNYETTSKEAKEEMLEGFLLSLRHVKRLKIGPFCSKTLTRLKAKGFNFPSNMKYHEWCGNDEEDSDSDSEYHEWCGNDEEDSDSDSE